MCTMCAAAVSFADDVDPSARSRRSNFLAPEAICTPLLIESAIFTNHELSDTGRSGQCKMDVECMHACTVIHYLKHLDFSHGSHTSHVSQTRFEHDEPYFNVRVMNGSLAQLKKNLTKNTFKISISILSRARSIGRHVFLCDWPGFLLLMDIRLCMEVIPGMYEAFCIPNPILKQKTFVCKKATKKRVVYT